MTTRQTNVSNTRLAAVAGAYEVTPEQLRDCERLVRRKLRRAEAEEILTALGIPVRPPVGGGS
ncbi:hypothetical protein [Streptomyces chryseus]|uniref:hypothetical protein n=1 Tax=Streptomyces chryseus TaxID=68186 RepID=UPI00110F6EEB|nr:hypothetical protein [Streptomyces chryseus]GGX02183.1 hypothetical protein GCM10010353_17340 [Streptomyces chryseus]